jgi:hypothetical protein
MAEIENKCACTEEYDSVTGENHQVACDWCVGGSDDNWSDDGCYCEYSYDRDGRWLDYECDKCAATHTPIIKQPTVVPKNPGPWATEKETISQFLYEVQWANGTAEKLPIIERLFRYIMTVKPFLDKFPKMRAVVAAKVAELKVEPLAVPILDVILATEAFLAAA